MLKGQSGIKKFYLYIYIPLPVLIIPLPIIPFATEKITSCATEAAKGANKNSKKSCFLFSISFFTITVTPFINTPECSNHFIILIISLISPFKINKVDPFLALRDAFALIFLSKLFTVFEAKLLLNPGKLSLAKGIARSVITSFFL